MHFCQRWKNADAELAERATVVELCWVNTSAQLKLLEILHPALSDQTQRILGDSVAVLAKKLDLAVIQIQKLQDPNSPAQPGFLHFRRKAQGAKYALCQSGLDATIQDVEAWQGRCKMALDLNMRDPNPEIGQRMRRMQETQVSQRDGATAPSSSPLSLTGGIRDALQPTGTLPSVFLPSMMFDTSAIPFSRAKTACIQPGSSNSKTRWFILDSLPCRPGTDVHALTGDVRDLARKLRHADPFAFGLLNCKGAMRVLGQPPGLDLAAFDLVFNLPPGTDAEQLQSLRALLLLPAAAPSLSRRLRLAQELATSVSYVHTFGFVHKNICPGSVLLGKEERSQIDAGAATPNRRSSFLIGFDSFRSAAGNTSLTGDRDWVNNIYRHPERMGEFPAEAYRMQHDIYSLGVCLLEMGLWESLIEYPEGSTSNPEYGRVCRDFLRTAKPWVFFKDHLVDLAENELPRRMGDRYASVVVTCLTCLDRDGDFGEEAEVDLDGITLGLRFIEVIFGQLKGIVI